MPVAVAVVSVREWVWGSTGIDSAGLVLVGGREGEEEGVGGAVVVWGCGRAV